jgi:putative DNA-invertase from lambdoid prophage Rac
MPPSRTRKKYPQTQRVQFRQSQPNEQGRCKVALYCRVSTHDQSCERQERDLRAFAKRADYAITQVFKETASGSKNDRRERDKVIQLARNRQIEAVLVTELTRWGRSTTDLLHTLQELESYGVSLIAQTGLQFDLTSPQGKLFATLLAALAEFERDLLRERVKSGIAAAQTRGIKMGRQQGQRPSDRKVPQVLALRKQGFSYRDIAHKVRLDKNTVMAILHRKA